MDLPRSRRHRGHIASTRLRWYARLAPASGRRWVEILETEIPKLEPDSGTKRVSTREHVPEVLEESGAGGGS